MTKCENCRMEIETWRSKYLTVGKVEGRGFAAYVDRYIIPHSAFCSRDCLLEYLKGGGDF